MRGGDKMRVLLVGSSGHVGQMVLHHWQRNPAATPITPQFRGTGAGGSLVWDPLEGALPLVNAVQSSGGFDTMIMLGGVTPRQGKNLGVNTTLAEACLSAASKAGIRRVLLASSSAVYGAGDGTAFTEHAPCNPANDYGASKLEMEQACARWRESGIDLCVLRIGNVAGADALLMNISDAGSAEAIEIDIFTDGRGPVRSYIGTKTMAQVLQSLCLYPSALPQILNVAAPMPLSMDTLADAAGHPWRRRTPSERALQNITLDCSTLETLHKFSALDIRPNEMVRQWKDTFTS